VIERACSSIVLKEKTNRRQALRRARTLQATIDALPDLLFDVDQQG
jgi:hypothetical protein